MRNTKENVIALLEEIEKTNRILEKHETSKEAKEHARGFWFAMYEARQLLVNQKFFNDVWEVFMEE